MTSGQPLRRTLVVPIVALFVLVILATTISTVLVTRASLTRQLDSQVAQTAARATDRGPRSDRSLTRTPTGSAPDEAQQGGTSPQPGAPTPSTSPSSDAPGHGLGGNYLLVDIRSGQPRHVVVFTDDGARETDRDLIITVTQQLLTTQLDRAPRTVDLGDGVGTYRVVRSDSPDGDVLISGLPTAGLEDTLRTIVLVTGGVGALAIVLLAGGTTWLIRLTLRPLERVADTAERVSKLPLHSGEVSLAERFPADHTDQRTEIGKVGSALNEMLDHVDASLQARQASETQLRQFVADASHELRTPLASIRGYTELSRRETEPIPEGIQHALGRIESESGRMAHLVEDLLLLARLDAGRPLERQPVDLTMLVIDAVSDARAAGPQHRWKLDLPEEAVEAVGDQARLTQVVVNLLANARTHTPPGTTVTSRVRADGRRAVIQVSDDGPGIPADLLPRAFARFARGDAARTRTGGSTGLGLSIVQAVVSAHGGTVQVASRQGRTVFTVALPIGGPPPTA
ncbi:MAG: HAMP domain-containing sensor histidine kinase [Dermatophilaceae bacterium]